MCCPPLQRQTVSLHSQWHDLSIQVCSLPPPSPGRLPDGSPRYVKTKLELRWLSSWFTFHGTAANTAKQKTKQLIKCVWMFTLLSFTWSPVITPESQPSRPGPGPNWDLGSPLHASLQAQQALRLRKMVQLGQRGHGEGAPPLPGTEAREGRNLGRLRATGPGAIRSTTNKQTNTDKIWDLNCQQRNYHFTIHNQLPVLLAHKSSHLRRSS